MKPIFFITAACLLSLAGYGDVPLEEPPVKKNPSNSHQIEEQEEEPIADRSAQERNNRNLFEENQRSLRRKD